MIDYTLCLIFHQTVNIVLTASDSGFGKFSRQPRSFSNTGTPAPPIYPVDNNKRRSGDNKAPLCLKAAPVFPGLGGRGGILLLP